MKFGVRVLFLAIMGLALDAQASVLIGFNDAPFGGIASNLANSAGVPTDGMTWGIVVDTTGNGFAKGGANYDPYANGVGTGGYLSADGSVTDDYYIPGATTVDGTGQGYTDGGTGTEPGHGTILDDMGPFSFPLGVASGQHFALIWFSANSSSNGSKYGFFTDASFVLPSDGSQVEFGSAFLGNDPVRSASSTFGVVLSSAKIAVFDGNGTGGSQRTDNTGTYTFANAVKNSSGVTQTFTLQNIGGQNLTSISASLAVTGNPGDFVLNTTGMATALVANATTSFTVTFAPTAVGSRTAVVQIASSDSTQNPFRINVAGIGTAVAGPSIAVFDGSGTGGNQRGSGVGTFSFGSIQTSLSSSAQTFTIQNNGTSTLGGANPPDQLAVSIATADANDFQLSPVGASTLAANATTTFTLAFTPQTGGTRSGVVTVSGSGLSFTINVSGFGADSQAPRIAVFKGSESGASLVNSAAVAFPTIVPGSSSTAQMFTIKNLGGEDLTNIAVTNAGTGNGADFVLNTTGTASTLAAGAATTFSVTFSPSAVGARAAAILIASNDATDNPFTINLTGQTHTLSFDQAAISHQEASETVILPVRLSSAFSAPFTVPVTFTATPANLSYTRAPSTSLTFAANQLVANVTLTLKDNLTIEADKTIKVSLGAPSLAGVTKGAFPDCTLTIVDNDTPPKISPAPVSQVVAAGSAVSFVSGASGSDPLTLQWKKGTVVLGTASTLSLTNSATLADAGAYTFTATNKRSSVSATVQLGVVVQTPTKVTFDVKTTATMTVIAAGNSLTYQWRDKNNAPLLNGAKYANVTTKTLSIKNVALTDVDVGPYHCTVTGPGGHVDGGPVTLQVPSAVPPSVTVAFPDCVAYNTYSYQLPFDTNPTDLPTKFACTGLPTGLVCNAATGLVSGKPTKLGVANVKVTLSNANGHVDIPTTLTVKAFPCPGVCVGLVDRHAATNGTIGGRLDLNVSTTGSFTGTLKLAGVSYVLNSSMITAGTAGAHPGVTLSIKRTGTPVPPPLTLTVDLDPAGDGLAGTVAVTGDSSSAAITGWRNLWHTTLPAANPVVAQLGLHAFNLQLDNASAALPNVPQGYGGGTVNVLNTGATTVSGRVADGGVVTCSGVLSTDGRVLVYQPLYTNHGSLTGVVSITADADHTINSALAWQKLSSSTVREYAPFGLLGVNASGGKYVLTKPVAGFTATPVGTNNALLTFADAGVESSQTNPNLSLRISNTNAVGLPVVNPGKVTFVLVPATGVFSGTFTLKDGAVTRASNAFWGQLVTTVGEGFGYFLLPQLASPPTTTATTSPILSGAVTLQGL